MAGFDRGEPRPGLRTFGLRGRQFMALFLVFVEEQARKYLVCNRLRRTVQTVDDQVRHHLLDLLCNQAILDRLGAVSFGLLVAERHGAEFHQRFAGIAHWMNVLFVAHRALGGAKLAVGIHHNGLAARELPREPANKARGVKAELL